MNHKLWIITEKRSNAIKKLQNGKLKCLVCSDVAARGLDIDDCDIVINYDLAPLEAIHIHRSGRTARAGSSGVCLTFTVSFHLREVHIAVHVILISPS